MCNKRAEQKCLLPNTTHLLNSNGSSNQLLCSSVTPFNASQHIQKSSLMNRWVFYQCTCKVCLGERDRITVDPLSDEWKITSWSWNGARWEEGRRRHVYTCTCSKARKEWPAKGKERPLITADRSQQKSQQPEHRGDRSREKRVRLLRKKKVLYGTIQQVFCHALTWIRWHSATRGQQWLCDYILVSFLMLFVWI